MKIFVSTCMILSFLGLSDSVCPRGGFNNDQPQFGPGCMYRCHCVGDAQCDNVTGVCPEGCAAGWMGPGCQYGDIAYNKQVQQLLYGNNSLIDGRNATDRLPLTCVGPTTLVEIDLNATYRISGLIITSREGGVFVYVSQTPIGLLDMPGCIRISVGLPDFGVTVSNSSFVTPSDITRTCFKQNTTEQLNTEIPVVCTTEIVGRYLVIRTPDNATRMTVCDVRVYGGRTLAYGHNASQSTSAKTDYGESVASLALDGNAATNFHSRSCTHTEDETSPWWKVNLEMVYNIMRIVLYNRQDCCAVRLSGFSVSFATNNTFSLVFKYPETTPIDRTEITTLSVDLAQEVEISLRNRTKPTALTLCEVFVFGDSKKYVTHWSGKRWVRKDKLLVTVLLSIYESWDTSLSMDPGDNVKCQVCIGCEKGMVVSVKVRIHVEDCQSNVCGWTCDTYCYCDGPIGKENKIHARCPGKCITGWWGHSCNNTCDTNCIGNTCNQRDGHCLECVRGKWGHLCKNNCTNCFNGTGCDVSDGICTVGCSSGLFGVNCSEPCGYCAGDGSCNRSTGACIHGCQPGWQDENCSIACSQGWYGLNCSSKCDNCANETCDFINGTCYLGCSEGYSGIGCFKRLKREETSVMPIGAPLGGALGAAGLLILIIIVAIILWKRRNGSRRAKQYHSEQPDPNISASQLFSNIYENTAAFRPEETKSVLKPEKERSFSKINTDREGNVPVIKFEEAGETIDQQISRSDDADIEVFVESDNKEIIGNRGEGDQQNTYYNTGINHKRSGKKIAVQDLSEYIKNGIHRSNCIEDEFKTLLSGPQHEMSIALKQINRQKNRYKGMYAYDKNRVILEPLPDDPDTDYINASFINGYKKEKAYIAAQGTIAANVNDFWRMIWQYDIQQVVMLTGLIEQGKQKCLQYWPNEGKHEYGMIRVELIEEDVCAEYVIRSLLLSKTGSKKQKTVSQFHFTSWPDRGVPDTASSLVHFWNKVRHSECADSPILVHCSAGIGRTGTYIALDYSFDEGSEEGYVNIFECINKLRQQRVGLVQTVEQYVYLHEVILEAFRDTGNVMSIDDFKLHYAQMRHIAAGMKQTKLRTEFEKLLEDEHIYFERDRMRITKSSDAKDEFLDGKLPENKTKNRCNNILPSERYRPFMSTSVHGRNDYINAVCLPTRKNGKGLLVTQMPLPDTVIDFWRLVYDYEVQSIVMLNEANMPGEEVGVYWPENGETSRHGPFVVTITSNVQKGSHIETVLHVSKHGEERTLALKQFVCSVWRLNDAVPKSIDGFLNLIDDVEDWKRQSGERPILVHCMNGAERSGLFCVLWCALEKLKSDREVAIRSIVQQMRIRRQHIIPNFEQYKFCHDVIFYSLEKSTTYINI